MVLLLDSQFRFNDLSFFTKIPYYLGQCSFVSLKIRYDKSSTFILFINVFTPSRSFFAFPYICQNQFVYFKKKVSGVLIGCFYCSYYSRRPSLSLPWLHSTQHLTLWPAPCCCLCPWTILLGMCPVFCG